MDRQARTGDTVLVKSRKRMRLAPNTAVLAGGRRGKDDRKENTLALVVRTLCIWTCHSAPSANTLYYSVAQVAVATAK